MIKNKFGQVWIETVIYTLVAFALIGTVLTFVKPKIEQMQDKALLDQSVEMLSEIKSIISSISGTSGNVRVIDVTIKKGFLEIDPANDLIIFQMESNAEYSEIGQEIIKDSGNTILLTEKISGGNLVTIKSNYSKNYNLNLDGQNEASRRLNKASSSYKISIENKGIQGDDKILMNIGVQ